jgi:hypothetical protein
MPNDFRAALARVQSDYSFYIECQTDPSGALEDYSLSARERAVLSDPELITEALMGGGDLGLPKGISITISGTHDWVNRTAPKKPTDSDEQIASELAAVKGAATDEERRESALRLMQLLG